MLVRERNIIRAFDSTLAAYHAALETHLRDPMEGVFPLSQGKTLASLGSLFERLSITQTLRANTARAMFEDEIARRREQAYRAGYARGHSGQTDDTGIEEHRQPMDLSGPVLRRKPFEFGGLSLDWLEYDSTIQDAFHAGLSAGREDRTHAAA
jgi:hypothetical protein